MDHDQIVKELKQDLSEKTKEIRMDILRIEEKLDTYSSKITVLETSVGFITKAGWALILALSSGLAWLASKYVDLLGK
jgi:hypothetical protein